jgi:hypothetical protein
LSKLQPWNEIDGLESASGIGTYTTTVSVNKKIKDMRVLLDVGDVEGTWGLEINGKSVTGIDWFGSEALDVTAYVKNGKNGKHNH